MLLETGLHLLGALVDLPDSNLALVASADDPLTVAGAGQGSHSVDVSVIDLVHQLARLRVEGSDLPIRPAAQNRFAISHESDAVAI